MNTKFLLFSVFMISVIDVVAQNKGLVETNLKNGEQVHIKSGSMVKFWYYSAKPSKLFSQPLERLDFNRHKNYMETNVIAITDSCLYFMRRPYLPIPLPIPFKPKLDSVNIKNIYSIHAFSGNAMNAIQNVTMNTTMGFVPSGLNGFPMMVLLPFSTSFLLAGVGDIAFPMHKLQKQGSNYKILTENVPVDSNLSMLQTVNMINNNASEDEWDIDKHTRWEKVYNKVYKRMYDSLLFLNKDRTIWSISGGIFAIPDYVRSEYDKNTGIDITDRKSVYGISFEYFVSQKFRIGMEAMFHRTKQHMDANMSSSSSSISGGMGSVMSMFSYYKYEVGELFGQRYRDAILSELNTLNADTTDEEIQNRIDWLKNKLVSRPKLYVLAGLGTVNTNLIRFSGSPTNNTMTSEDYSQKSIAIESGLGVFTRLGKRLVYDMSFKYIWTPNYSPSIGGLNSYSGFKLQFNIGLITNSGFNMLKDLR